MAFTDEEIAYLRSQRRINLAGQSLRDGNLTPHKTIHQPVVSAVTSTG